MLLCTTNILIGVIESCKISNMFLGVAGAADSAGPGRGQGVASHSHRPAAAADCQVRCWWWTRPAHAAGNRGFMASNVLTTFNPCICRSSHTRCSPNKELLANRPSASPSRVWHHCKAGSRDHSGANMGSPFVLYQASCHQHI